jgi:hypothetical protein
MAFPVEPLTAVAAVLLVVQMALLTLSAFGCAKKKARPNIPEELIQTQDHIGPFPPSMSSQLAPPPAVAKSPIKVEVAPDTASKEKTNSEAYAPQDANAKCDSKKSHKSEDDSMYESVAPMPSAMLLKVLQDMIDKEQGPKNKSEQSMQQSRSEQNRPEQPADGLASQS